MKNLRNRIRPNNAIEARTHSHGETSELIEFMPDIDLDESNCTPETLAYLNRPDEESGMSDEDWKAMYAKRVEEGYYEKNKREIPDSELPF